MAFLSLLSKKSFTQSPTFIFEASSTSIDISPFLAEPVTVASMLLSPPPLCRIEIIFGELYITFGSVGSIGSSIVRKVLLRPAPLMITYPITRFKVFDVTLPVSAFVVLSSLECRIYSPSGK